MSMELAFLLTDRAPLRNTEFHALLYLALKANDYDFVCTSVRSLAKGMRMSEARARIALKSLEAKEYILKTRYGASRNPHAGYYAVRRETLLVQPAVDKHRKSFARILSSHWQGVILRGHARTVTERERRLQQWEQLGDEAKHEGLSRILLDPELLFHKRVSEDVQRLQAWMQLSDGDKMAVGKKKIFSDPIASSGRSDTEEHDAPSSEVASEHLPRLLQDPPICVPAALGETAKTSRVKGGLGFGMRRHLRFSERSTAT